MGHQFSKWRLSKHAQATAALSKPESKEIAKLSGITEAPHRARMCLGCHATASEEEDWQRAEGFHSADGVQCEVCHGPGSEYAQADIMRDPKLAMANGLMMPDKVESCLRCHRAKGSHEAVLKKVPFDTNATWIEISHPLPMKRNRNSETNAAIETAFHGTAGADHVYTGVMGCAECHDGPDKGFQFSKWRLSAHAKAYARLATPRGRELAKEAGVTGNPQHSPECLKCHATGVGLMPEAFQKSFDVRDGVQCEACHGAGADYSPEAIMLDKGAARSKGLLDVTEKTCLPCHEKAHGKAFNYSEASKLIAHPSKPVVTAAAEPVYRNPQNLTLTPDGKELWITCEASACVVIVDPASRREIEVIPVGGQPHDVAFSPDGKRAFVSNRLDDSVSVVDVASRKVVAVVPVGDEPHGLLVDRQGRYLYVLNTSIDNISVVDLATLKEVKRLSASRSPWSLALSPDGKRILVSHALSRLVKDRTPSVSEIAVINTETATIEDRWLVPGANLLQGIAFHPGGEYALVSLLRTKNLVPMTRINHGWTISNGLGVLWKDGTVDQVLLDQNDLCFPDPIDVCITPDGKLALVTSSSTDRVAVIDLEKLIALLKTASPEERQRVIPNHTGKPAEYVIKTIPTRTAPRGITCSVDNSTAYVASMLDDSVSVLDLRRMELVDAIDLGGSKEVTKRRRGEKLFHSANVSFRRQFSCSSCHPDGHIDNIVYDIEDDGLGMGPIDNRTLRGINDMAPYKWNGVNPSLRRQCGPRLAVFITRIQPFTSEQLDDLHYYLCSIPRPPNRYRASGADLTEAQRRGKAMFERSRKNDGSAIAVELRCNTCHPPPLYTDGRLHDVGTKFAYDHTAKYDVPHLLNIYDSAPYLHNGIAWTLEEVWTKYNPYDKHGVTNDMTKDQLNDLIEYLKTL
jgi:YVTN family beta-propeller protein